MQQTPATGRGYIYSESKLAAIYRLEQTCGLVSAKYHIRSCVDTWRQVD